MKPTQSTGIPECFAADGANQRLLVGVDEHVLIQSLFGGKALVTNMADVRLV